MSLSDLNSDMKKQQRLDVIPSSKSDKTNNNNSMFPDDFPFMVDASTNTEIKSDVKADSNDRKTFR
eukprot:gnl/Chilomastix_caulleri/6640.p2 GENE.gnl/Chilomastix_caulleri/6640~~gnl/Chilomastix_caulleri/6640.p2  ORF type:complete len:66 (+),score=18.60 gnl/Chilomastix_caulleri/6640:107-304(+)